MFPRRIIVLLRFFDAWGYCTEFPIAKKYSRATLFIFLLHITLATMSFFIFAYLQYWNMTINHYEMHLIVNQVFHFSSILLTYYTIITESYTQRKVQRQFWQFVRQIDDRFHRHKCFTVSSYLFECTEFLVVFSLIQIKISGYFATFNGAYRSVYYVLAYIPVVKMYLHRVFYYLFYVELVNFELKAIKDEVKAVHDVMRNDFLWVRGSTDFPIQNIKWARNYYCLIHRLSLCLNSMFGWSQFATILCCFYFLLTDLNWAYERITTFAIDYSFGNMNRRNIFRIYFFKHSSQQVFTLWTIHLVLVIYYLFRATSQSENLVRFLMSNYLNKKWLK